MCSWMSDQKPSTSSYTVDVGQLNHSIMESIVKFKLYLTS